MHHERFHFETFYNHYITIPTSHCTILTSFNIYFHQSSLVTWRGNITQDVPTSITTNPLLGTSWTPQISNPFSHQNAATTDKTCPVHEGVFGHTISYLVDSSSVPHLHQYHSPSLLLLLLLLFAQSSQPTSIYLSLITRVVFSREERSEAALGRYCLCGID